MDACDRLGGCLRQPAIYTFTVEASSTAPQFGNSTADSWFSSFTPSSNLVFSPPSSKQLPFCSDIHADTTMNPQKEQKKREHSTLKPVTGWIPPSQPALFRDTRLISSAYAKDQ